jgi:hypothetical protein
VALSGVEDLGADGVFVQVALDAMDEEEPPWPSSPVVRRSRSSSFGCGASAGVLGGRGIPFYGQPFLGERVSIMLRWVAYASKADHASAHPWSFDVSACSGYHDVVKGGQTLQEWRTATAKSQACQRMGLQASPLKGLLA